ncbi:MAG: hypothetical protein H0T76_23715 [Nannocystis sp.]|nr:hypothetical protein [Nannocystis sp.]MBA3549494.1 hypothetical protein [Nannocystis sp.]
MWLITYTVNPFFSVVRRICGSSGVGDMTGTIGTIGTTGATGTAATTEDPSPAVDGGGTTVPARCGEPQATRVPSNNPSV